MGFSKRTQKRRVRALVKRRLQKQEREVLPKLAGLSLLKRVLKPEMGALLPYRIVRHPEAFSISAFHPLPDRILVRSDLAVGTGMEQALWISLPRQTFVVNKTVPTVTQTNIRVFMKDGKTCFPWNKKLFFVLHPLRPLSEYGLVGNVFVSVDPQGKKRVRFRLSADSNRTLFKEAEGLPSNFSPSLKKRVDAVVHALLKTGLTRFELSFVTYTDRTDFPEFYDLLLRKPHRSQAEI